MAVHIARHQFTVDDYYKMAENGVLTEDSRVELIEGEIVDMPPIGHEHAGHVNRSTRYFSRDAFRSAMVAIQNPLRLGPRSEPQPDVLVLRARQDDYTTGHPTPADVLLLIEVADTSLPYDRETKGSLYARAGIVEYWILNLIDRQLEVRREPNDDGYAAVRILKPGDTIQPLAFPDISVAVDDLLA